MKRLIIYSLFLLGLVIFKYGYYSKKINSVVNKEDFKELNIHKNEFSRISDVQQILDKLNKSDQKLRPIKKISKDGSITYSYNKLKGELNLNKFQLENRIKNFEKLFIRERNEIKNLLFKLESINVSIFITEIDNNIGGIWKPEKNQIILNSRLLDFGSKAFHNVLAHESIHVAQSCYAGSVYSLPRKLGLPVDFSISMDNKLNHPVYSSNSEENISIEREAYTYSNELGAALYMLSRYCL